MAWNNPPLVVYHGTSLDHAEAMIRPAVARPHSIDLSFSRKTLDFGPGFYVTTSRRQAKSWANIRAARQKAARRRLAAPPIAAVVRFELDRNALAGLRDLVFVNEAANEDYWAFVSHCRDGLEPVHGQATPYDVVYGPVCAWPQPVLFKDCDQIGLHTEAALANLLNAVIVDRGDPLLTM